MARSSFVAAAILAACAATGATPAGDLCEGCWEAGGRGTYLLTSGDTGSDPAPAFGVEGAFRFKPFWSVRFALDRAQTRVPDGADETLHFLTIAFEYTLRAEREQRTRPVILFVAGFGFDHVSADTASAGPVVGRSEPGGDHGLTYGLGAGALTTLTDRLYLRYEGRCVRWSSFGAVSKANEILVALDFKFGQ
ncbi:MAG: outer membrane beta-barrel protein [Acidobacteria bacterium]|nr:outer membrane beta-barrel protein [Acidobacteriota bacterium]